MQPSYSSITDQSESYGYSGYARGWILLLLVSALVVCVLGSLLVPAGLGYIAGQRELQVQSHEAAIQHFNRGLSLLADNYPESAMAEFEIALKYDSGFEPAQQKLAGLQPKIVNGTPQSNAEDQVAMTLFTEARNFVLQREWSDAITRLEQLRTLKADYRASDVKSLLYQAYVEGGRDAVRAGQIELARERFDGALLVNTGDPEVTKQRDLAVLYLEGKQAMGFNWQTAIQKFTALDSREPNFYDAKKQLFEAHWQYADIALKQNSPCLAAREYDSALILQQDASVSQKRTQAMNLCKQAIISPPTATPVITGTVTITTPTILPTSTATTPISGVENYAYKLTTATDKSCNNGAGDISGTIRDAQGKPMVNVLVGYYIEANALTIARSNVNGQYLFLLGKEPASINVAMMTADAKTTIPLVAFVSYPGASSSGCHLILDWQKVQ
jgi:type II secretory pathway pseudopilin PulG